MWWGFVCDNIGEVISNVVSEYYGVCIDFWESEGGHVRCDSRWIMLCVGCSASRESISKVGGVERVVDT